MNNKRIEKMIPIALSLIEGNKYRILNNNGELPSNYAGYIKSYGPMIRQSGLFHAVIFNEKGEKSEEGEVERWKINALLLDILKDTNINYSPAENCNKLSELIKKISDDPIEKRRLKNLLLEAIVACKFAMMTFPQEKKKEV